MTRLLAILLLGLAGCVTTDRPADVPPSDKPGAVDAYGDKADLVMSRAAAAVDVARVANKEGKPAVVESELEVAATYLPRPANEDLVYARERAAKATPEGYAKAKASADKHQRELDTVWAKVEAEKQKAKDQLEKARLEQERQIAAKEAEIAAEREFWRDLVITGIGGFIILASVAGWFWGTAFGVSKAEAGVGLLVGAGVAVLPHVMDNEYAGYALAGAALLGLAKLGQVLFLNRHEAPKDDAP